MNISAFDISGVKLSSFLFFFFFGCCCCCCTHGIWKFLGRGSKLSHSCDLWHSCSRARSLNQPGWGWNLHRHLGAGAGSLVGGASVLNILGLVLGYWQAELVPGVWLQDPGISELVLD